MRKILLITIVSIGFISIAAATANAATQISCGTLADSNNKQVSFGANWTCYRVSVPLDRDQPSLGSVSLRAAYYHQPGPQRETVLALAGGPGQGAFNYSLVFQKVLKPLLQTRDLLVFDQRGTGDSGYLNMKACTQDVDSQAGYRHCVATLGQKRFHYSTYDSVQDIESIRQELHIPSLLPTGVSYGTKVAGDYARYYPQQTAGVIMDSPLAPDGLDLYGRDSLQATPRIFDSLCANNACRWAPQGSVELRNFLGLQNGVIRQQVPWGKKGHKTLYFSQRDLLSWLLGADFSTADRLGIPGPLQSAVNGDSAALLRYNGTDSNTMSKANYGLATNIQARSTGADESELDFVLTTCSDVNLPWQLGVSGTLMASTSVQALSAASLASFYGWNRAASLDLNIPFMCASFGGFGGTTRVSPAYPTSVPTLVIEGSDDIRTTVENANGYQQYGATVQVIPHGGHSNLTSDNPCVAATLASFSDHTTPAPCSSPKHRPVVTKPIKTSATGLSKTEAISDTIIASYATNPLEQANTVRAGLRGGYYEILDNNGDLAGFHQYRFYRNLRMSGKLNLRSGKGSLQLSGAFRGRLTSTVVNKKIVLKGTINGRKTSIALTTYINKIVASHNRAAAAYSQYWSSQKLVGRSWKRVQTLKPTTQPQRTFRRS